MDRQKTLSSDGTDHGIHLDDGCIRVLRKVIKEVLVAPSKAAALIDLVFLLLLSGTQPGLSGHVAVLDIKEVGIQVVVEGLLAAHDLVLMGNVDLMERLSPSDQRHDQSVDMGDLGL